MLNQLVLVFWWTIALLSSMLLGVGDLRSQTPERLKLVEELRIGSVDDPQDNLSRIGDVRIGSGGEIYVWQGMVHRMFVFAPDGRRMHDVGARGAGPGEFLGGARWTWKADTLAAFDRDQQRFSLFSPDGSHIRTGRVLPEGSLGTVVLEWLMADGSAVGWPRTQSPRHLPRPRLRFRGDGTFQDTLFKTRGVGGAARLFFPRGTVLTFRRPIDDSDLVAVDPRGRHVTVVERSAAPDDGPSTFRVYRIGLSRDTVFDRRVRYTPRAIDAEWADSVVRNFRTSWTGREVLGQSWSKSEIDMMVDSLALPSHYPPVFDAIVGRDDRTWLQISEAGNGPTNWAVLNSRGDLVAFVRGPGGVELRNAEGSRVWGVVHDALEVPYLVRYRLEPH